MLTPDDLRGAVTLKGRNRYQRIQRKSLKLWVNSMERVLREARQSVDLLISRGEGKMAGRSGIYARPSFRYALKREPGEHSAEMLIARRTFRASSALVPG